MNGNWFEASLSADLVGDGCEHPSDVVTIGDESTSLGKLDEQFVQGLSLLIDGLQEAEAVSEDDLELSLVERLLAELLLNVEVSQPDLASMLQDEWSLY